jgi:hypothetical protein
MQMEPFYLLLRYMSLARQVSRYDQSEQVDKPDPIADAMRKLDADQRAEIVSFIDRRLAANLDHKALERVFDDGNTYRVWHTDDGPRQLLLAIRDAALATASTSSTARRSPPR